MVAEVKQIAQTFFPEDSSVDDNGPWKNLDSEQEIAQLIDGGFSVASTAVCTLDSDWVRDCRVDARKRLIVITTLVRK